jgi:hypothetical protein
MIFSHCPIALTHLKSIDLDQGRILFSFPSKEICSKCELKGHINSQCHLQPSHSLDESVDDDDILSTNRFATANVSPQLDAKRIEVHKNTQKNNERITINNISNPSTTPTDHNHRVVPIVKPNTLVQTSNTNNLSVPTNATSSAINTNTNTISNNKSNNKKNVNNTSNTKNNNSTERKGHGNKQSNSVKKVPTGRGQQ